MTPPNHPRVSAVLSHVRARYVRQDDHNLWKAREGTVGSVLAYRPWEPRRMRHRDTLPWPIAALVSTRERTLVFISYCDLESRQSANLTLHFYLKGIQTNKNYCYDLEHLK